MEVCRRSSWLLLLLGVFLLATTLQGVQGEVESEGPSESECRPHIEKALKELETADGVEGTDEPDAGISVEDVQTIEITDDDSANQSSDGDDDKHEGNESVETEPSTDDQQENAETESSESEKTETEANATTEDEAEPTENENLTVEKSDENEEQKTSAEEQPDEPQVEEVPADEAKEDSAEETTTTENLTEQEIVEQIEDTKESTEQSDKTESPEEKDNSAEEKTENVDEGADSVEEKPQSIEDEESVSSKEDDNASVDKKKESEENKGEKSAEDTKSGEQADETQEAASVEDTKSSEQPEETEEQVGSVEEQPEEPKDDSKEEGKVDKSEEKESVEEKQNKKAEEENKTSSEQDETDEDTDSKESAPEEELSLDIEVPTDLREREHVEKLLKLDDSASETEAIINRAADITLKELKKLYENAIKPLEVLYKYRDLSNRHFGDSEIFSKPLILFMGPWSGGKSSIVNYLLDNEYNETSLRTGAEPSPAYFNLLMHGEEPEILDGTQLAADYTFAGLQKFGQGLEERLRGVKLPNKLLEKVNIVEIPGILEVRKQVSRVFPFNDACQWFIDRADIIFLVYDPSKLDVGPETEAILDQLKGREHQTRIILNKADQVKPEELMRVQGALIWNISPLMSSPQPPVMYTASLWSRPYESWAPVRLLHAQERAFLRDLRSAVDKRIENKIASARRFAVRVRNHAKMVDCYLTTYYNHKSVFGNRKQVADEIIEHPQDYHIYEGLSTLTNISRYDLPDPDVYKDFFKLNPLYEFQQLSATCTYFRGCPINRLDIAIAYDLPELVGKHKRLVENALADVNTVPSS